MYLTLSEVKTHLLLDESYKSDDAYCISLIEAAESAVASHLNRPLKECLKNGELEPSVKHAVLLLIGNWYANREAVTYGSAKPVPLAFEYLIALNKRYGCP